MTQSEKRVFLIKALLAEDAKSRGALIPEDEAAQWRLLRSLMNVRPPRGLPDDVLAIQDEYLRDEAHRRGIVKISDLAPVSGNIYLWQGDITRLACDAIVNAANSGLTGCYIPCHACIDNCIHTFAGMELRLECAEIIRRQGREESPGGAKITGAYNLPSKYILHTVGPIVADEPTSEEERLLASCYTSCLELASAHNTQSVAFCCISTGVFRFPNVPAAAIAIRTTTTWLERRKSDMKIIFNVFKDTDFEIYRRLLGQN